MDERVESRANRRALREHWLTTTALATGIAVLTLAPQSVLAACGGPESIIFCSGTTS